MEEADEPTERYCGIPLKASKLAKVASGCACGLRCCCSPWPSGGTDSGSMSSQQPTPTNRERRRVLIPVDGSESAKYAVKYAVQHLLHSCDDVTIMHVHKLQGDDEAPESEVMTSEGGGTASSELDVPRWASQLAQLEGWVELTADDQIRIQERLDNIGRGIVTEAARPLDAAEISWKMIVRNGDARESIVDLLSEDCHDMVIMGARGLGPMKRYPLGSVTDYVARHSPTPVFIVRRPRAQSPQGSLPFALLAAGRRASN